MRGRGTYAYRDDLTRADVAFNAEGSSLEELFLAASDATLSVMVSNAAALVPAERRVFRAQARAPGAESRASELLYALLQRLLYYKDAESLLLRVERVAFGAELASLDAVLSGEPISHEQHALGTDVKAVTLHHFTVRRTGHGWSATVVLDT